MAGLCLALALSSTTARADDSTTADSSWAPEPDGTAGAASAAPALSVASLNRPPSAINDSTWTPSTPGSSARVNVLANDSDPDNGPLTIQEVGPAAHGTATLETGVAAPTAIIYDPVDGYAGSDSFSYVIRDAQGLPPPPW